MLTCIGWMCHLILQNCFFCVSGHWQCSAFPCMMLYTLQEHYTEVSLFCSVNYRLNITVQIVLDSFKSVISRSWTSVLIKAGWLIFGTLHMIGHLSSLLYVTEV
jgi:hypothetical protein